METKNKRKRKYIEENRSFQKEWEYKYFFIECNDKALCLLCQKCISQFKSSNLQRHFSSLHAHIDQEFPTGSERRNFKLMALKNQADVPAPVPTIPTKQSHTVTLASYCVAWNIARAKKAYSEGDFIKTCLTDVISILSPEDKDLQKKISDLQLSRHTIERRISNLNSDIEWQMRAQFWLCEYFSFALDVTSIGPPDKAQLSVFVRTVSEDCVIHEELLDIVSVNDKISGRELKESLMLVLVKNMMPLSKLTAIATDGSSSLIDPVHGLIGLCKSDESFPMFLAYHCIVHLDNLVSNDLELNHVIKPILDTVNLIRTSVLIQNQFHDMFKLLDEDYHAADLTQSCTLSWLLKGKILARFFKMLESFKMFMKENQRIHSKFTDPQWVLDLAFLVDMLQHLQKVTFEIQGKSNLLPNLLQNACAFINKLQLFHKQMLKGELSHFSTMSQHKARSKEHVAESLKQRTFVYANVIEKLRLKFVERFKGLQKLKPQIRFLIDPFSSDIDCMVPPFVTDEAAAQTEIIKLREDDKLKDIQKKSDILELWKSVPKDIYPNIKGAALKLISMFSSTNLCESVYSTLKLKHVKSKQRSVLTDGHLRELLHVSTTELKPNFAGIVEHKECQKSH